MAQKFALLDDTGRPVAFFDLDINSGKIPAEAVEISDAQWRELVGNQGQRRLVDGVVVQDLPSPPTVEQYQYAIQNIVDETAREKQFNDGVTLASYIGSTVGVWASQAAAFVAWRDNVWQYAYLELAKVQAGEREQPTIEAFLLELPEIAWP